MEVEGLGADVVVSTEVGVGVGVRVGVGGALLMWGRWSSRWLP